MKKITLPIYLKHKVIMLHFASKPVRLHYLLRIRNFCSFRNKFINSNFCIVRVRLHEIMSNAVIKIGHTRQQQCMRKYQIKQTK